MKKYFLIFPVAALLLMVSCYEDKGNYTYRDIGEAVLDIPAITAKDNTVLYVRFEDVHLDPEVTYQGEDASDDYTYEWSLHQKNVSGATDPKKIIGETKVLDYHLVETPATYVCVLKATNKQTGATSFYNFEITVGSITGWMVLDEDADGNGDLSAIIDADIIPGSDANGVARDIYSGTNEGAKFRKARSLFWRHQTIVYLRYNFLTVFSDDGCYQINDGTYLLNSTDYNYWFKTAQAADFVVDPQGAYYENPNYGAMDYLMNNGRLYYIYWRSMGSVDRYTGPVNMAGVELRCHPFIAGIYSTATTNTARGVFYNTENFPEGTFITCDAFGTQASSWNRPSVAGGAFQPNSINPTADTDLQLVYMGTARNGTTGAFFRDMKNGGKPWILHGDFRLIATPLALGKYDVSALPGIDAATQFAFGTRGDVFFYGSGSSVYSHAFPGGATNTLLTVGAGETIAQMKVYFYNDNADFTGRLLFVATNSAAGGKVYKIKFNELTGAIIGTPQEFDGFGTILDMTIKFK